MMLAIIGQEVLAKIIGQEVLAKIIGQYLEDLITDPVKLVKTQLTEEGSVLTTVVLED